LLRQSIGVKPLDRLHDAGVQPFTPLLQQAAVGDLVGERVLEGVFEVGEQSLLVDELCSLQGPQPLLQRVGGESLIKPPSGSGKDRGSVVSICSGRVLRARVASYPRRQRVYCRPATDAPGNHCSRP
jgi:hypothetical protein